MPDVRIEGDLTDSLTAVGKFLLEFWDRGGYWLIGLLALLIIAWAYRGRSKRG